MMAPPPGRRLTWLSAVVVLVLDQAAKALFLAVLEPGRPVTIIPGFFSLTLVTNTGGVFGILRDLEGPLRSILFGLLPLAAIALMIWYARALGGERRSPLAAIGMILGGAAGNLVDRVRWGHVVDFLDAYVGSYHWPAFNLADSAICIGVALLLLDGLAVRRAGDGARTLTPPEST
jgi:signal peptidase II